MQSMFLDVFRGYQLPVSTPDRFGPYKHLLLLSGFASELFSGFSSDKVRPQALSWTLSVGQTKDTRKNAINTAELQKKC